MSFWNSDKLTIKQRHKFVLVIGGYPIYTVKTVTKPTATLETKQFRMINHYYNYPGLVKWEPITITFADAYGDDNPTIAVRDTALNTARYLRKLLKIQQINAKGDKVVEEWTLVNPLITKINWGELDYSSADGVEYSLDVIYDYALFNDEGSVIKAERPEKIRRINN